MRSPVLQNRSGPPLRPAPLFVLLPLLVLLITGWTSHGQATARFATQLSPAGTTLVSAELAISIRT